MRIIKANAKLVEHSVPEYQFIERVGRTCYKSEDKMTDTSTINFIEGLVKRGHMAMLEHEYIYAKVDCDSIECMMDITAEKYINSYCGYISGSFRAFSEAINATDNQVYDDLKVLLSKKYPEVFNYDIKDEGYGTVRLLTREQFITEVTEKFGADKLFRLLPHTVLFTCDRGVTHELVRHRPVAFAMESTRYCSYDKGKFGNEITVIKPLFFEEGSEQYNIWKQSCEDSEKAYMSLINARAKAQEARSVLNNSIKADIWMTATEEEWQHIIDLRYHGTTGAPHPQMKEVMSIAYEQLVKASDNRIK